MKKVSLLVGLIMLLASGAAFATPTTMNFTGRLSTASGPVSTTVSLTFTIFDSATGGTQRWTEPHGSVTGDNGLVYVLLGQTSPLDENLFNGDDLYLEITVGSETLTPRMRINSVPYAIRSIQAEKSITADSVTGLNTGDLLTGAAGNSPITASTSSHTVSIGLEACADGQIYKYSSTSGSWECSADAGGTAYTAGEGIAINGASIALRSCSTAGQVLKYQANGTWACATDVDTDTNTTYSAGTHISISGTNAISLDTTGNLTWTGRAVFNNATNSFSGDGSNLTGLNANAVQFGILPVARGGTGSAPGAANPGSVVWYNGTVAGYQYSNAGVNGQVLTMGPSSPVFTNTLVLSGLTVNNGSSSSVGVSGNLNAGSLGVTGSATVTGTVNMGYQIVTSTGTPISTASSGCANYGGATCYYASGGAFVACPTGKVVIGGGCEVRQVAFADGNVKESHPVNNGWNCGANAETNVGTLYAYAICARMGN